jgi:hypothetical protein
MKNKRVPGDAADPGVDVNNSKIPELIGIFSVEM